MMFLKELKKILDFKKSDINFRYCFYVENNNIFHYLKKYIYKKSDKFKVLLFTNEEIFYKKNKNIYSLNIKNKFLNYFFFKNLNVKYAYASTPDLNNSYFVKSKNNCKYIYIQHSPISLINAYNHKAFNNFNAIQTINTHQFLETKLKGVYLIKPYIFKDFRGSYTEIYNKIIFKKNKKDIPFIQDDISISKKNVLRGIHGDGKTWKLVSCLNGKFYLIVVNNDKKSKQYKKWISFTLDDKKKFMVLIPPKFGNGHVVLSSSAIFHYKQNTMYDRKSQFTLKWNDKDFKFKWPIVKPILSRRDK